MVEAETEIEVQINRFYRRTVVCDRIPEIQRISGDHKRAGIVAERQVVKIRVRGDIVVRSQPRGPGENQGIILLGGFVEPPIVGGVEIVVTAATIPNLWHD